MPDARRALNESDRAKVAAAVTAAEKKTAAEIVCAVATESGRYDRAEALVGLGAGLLALTGVNVIHLPGHGAWGPSEAIALPWQLLSVSAGFAAGNVLASYVHLLRRLCVSKAEMDAEVSRAAGHVFQTRRLATTRARGGVLVYVSLFEHEVVILADHAAHQALGDAGLAAVRDVAQARLRAHDSRALVACAEALGDKLAGPLPRAADDTDELPEPVVVIHPRP